jgi:hypothetical protein
LKYQHFLNDCGSLPSASGTGRNYIVRDAVPHEQIWAAISRGIFWIHKIKQLDVVASKN